MPADVARLVLWLTSEDSHTCSCPAFGGRSRTCRLRVQPTGPSSVAGEGPPSPVPEVFTLIPRDCSAFQIRIAGGEQNMLPYRIKMRSRL